MTHSELPDELNPEYLFSCIATELLVKAMSGEIDLNILVKNELSNRGLNNKGEWKGFNK